MTGIAKGDGFYLSPILGRCDVNKELALIRVHSAWKIYFIFSFLELILLSYEIVK